MELTIEIPDDHANLVVQCLCAAGNYQATLDDGSVNPVTPQQFARQMVARYIRNVVKAQLLRSRTETLCRTIDEEASAAIIVQE